MKLRSIEPTPSPNSMKLNLDTTLPAGIRRTYTQDNIRSAPAQIQQILAINGVKSVFHTADFMAVDRFPNADWGVILGHVREIFNVDHIPATDQANALDTEATYGEAQVYVQFYRGIPMQIRVKNESAEERIALSQRFTEAINKAAGSTLIKERKLVDYGIRYGELEEIALEVEEEIEAAYTEERLQSLIEQAVKQGESEQESIEIRRELTDEELSERLNDDDWRVRFAALESMKPSVDKLHLIEKALEDSRSAIRRLAVVYIGEIGEEHPEVALPLLFKGLRDPSVPVRRTAGDALSDIGHPDAIGPMIEALEDSSKLVRWRAARFLYEVGDETAVAALRKASEDPEFEVSLQARIALERIEKGEAAAGSVWQQMARRNE